MNPENGKSRMKPWQALPWFLLALWVGTVSAGANGIILPPPQPPVPMPQPLAIERSLVTVEIKNFVATTHVDQVFFNQYPHPIEGTYLFPLPEEAAISDFAMYVDGKRYAAELLERDEARRIYEGIVRRQRDPALLEYIGRNLFRASIFPIPGRSEKRIELEYSQVLQPQEGVCQYVYPMKVQAFFERSPRPQPLPTGREGRASEEPLYRQYPGIYGQMAISVKIDSEVPIKAVYSPTHDLDVKRQNDHFVSASFEQREVRPEQDFLLYYTLSEKDFGVNLLAHRRFDDEEGFFMLLLAPKYEVQQEEVAAKDLVLVLDTSGSMSGEKIAQARKALLYCLDNLNPQDRFNVIPFSTEVDPFEKGLVEASPERIRAAKEFVRDLKPRGGTDIHGALQEALKQLSEDSDRPQMVAFLTDGLPTVGETDPKTILRNVDRANEKRDARLFVFGVGDDVNTHLLDRLAEDNRGVSTYVRPHEDLEVAVSLFYNKISYPVLADLQLDFEGIEVSNLYPRHLPDLFRGSQVTVFGRYQGHGAAKVKLQGQLEGKTQAFEYRLDFPDRERRNGFIPRLWAMRKVGYLLDEIRLHGEDRELKEEVVRLATRYGIVTPYTSFLIQEPTPGREEREVAALPAPASMSGVVRRQAEAMGGGGAGGMMGPGMTSAPDYGMVLMSETGPQAVDVSQALAGMKQGEQDYQVRGETARHAGDKLFYQRDGVWVDSQWPEKPAAGQKVLAVKYDSEAYWSLLRRFPELGPYLALGEKVQVVFEGVLITVGETGQTTLTDEDLAFKSAS